MNSKRSFSSISVPFIVENLKRFWIGSAFALVGYICACCIPLLMGGVHNGNVSSILRVSYAPVVLLTFIVPIVAAMLIYSYMQQQSSAAIVHSLPYTRKQIFHSSFISGLILCIVPVVITGLILTLTSILSEPVLYTDFDPQTGFFTYDIFTPGKVMEWMGIICLFNAVVFAVSAFAAVITGSTLVQAMLSMVLLFIIPALLELVSLVGQRMLYGYVQPEWVDTICSYTSAPIAMIEESMTAVLCQICIAFLLYVLAYCLYNRRHMEKARDTLVFNFTKPVVKYVVAFIGMCCFGFFLEAFYDGAGNNILYVGAFIGALVAYVASDMLIQKRIRIKGFVNGFGLYFAAAVIFFGIFAFDIFGYETSTPDADEVKGVYIEGISAEYYKHYAMNGEGSEGMIQDTEAIQRVLNLHSALINERDTFFEKDNSYYLADTAEIMPADITYTWVDIVYVLENGKEVKRSYDSIPENWLYSNEDVRSLVESEPYKEMIYPILGWELEDMALTGINLLPSYEGDVCGKKTVQISDQDRMEQLFNAYQEDLRSLTFEEMNISGSENRALFTVELAVKNSDVISEELNKEYYEYYGYYYSDDHEYFEYNVNRHYEKTLALLKEWGIYNSLVVSANDIDHMNVVKVEIREDNSQKEYPSVTITDREAIQTVLDTAASDWYNYDLRYEITAYPNNRTMADECIYLYYDPDNVPEFISGAF